MKPPQGQTQAQWLALAGQAAANLRQVTEQRDLVRDEFVGIIRAAKLTGATQQQIADATGYSRQRIAQFLNKPRS
jgi:hypothetical protein